MKKVFIAIAMVFGLSGTLLLTSSLKVHAANVSVTAPTSGGRYSQIPVAYQATAAIVSNDVTYTFVQVPVGTTYTVVIDALTNPFSSQLNPHSIYSNVNVQSASGTTIPDDFYNITVSWQRASDNVVESTTINSVIIDTTTLPGIIDEPQTGESYTTSMPLSLYLPDPALSGTVKVTFHNNGTGINTTMNIIDSPPGFAFYVNPRALVAVSPITGLSASSLAPGNYNMTLSYQDDLGNPLSTVSENNITIAADPVAPPVAPPPAGSTPTPSPTPTPTTTVVPTTISVNGTLVSAPVTNADGTPITNVVVSQPAGDSSVSLMLMLLLCCLGSIVLVAVIGYLIYQNPKVQAWIGSMKAK